MPPHPGSLSDFNVGPLAHSLLESLEGSSRHQDLVLILRDDDEGSFRVQAQRGYSEVDLSQVQFALESPLIRHFSSHPTPAQHSQLTATPWVDLLPQKERDSLAKFPGTSFVPLHSGMGLVGLLVLGKARPRHAGRNENWLWDYEGRRIAALIEALQLDEHRKTSQGLPTSVIVPPRQPEIPVNLEQSTRSIAHDLNNILTTIIAHAQLLENAAESREIGRHTTAIRQAVLDGAESVRQMRGLAAQSVPIQPTVVDVNKLIASTLQMIEPRWRLGIITPASALARRAPLGSNSGQRILPPDGPGLPFDLVVNLNPAGCVVGSPTELRNVITNLISNAVAALPPQRGRIEIGSHRDGECSVITVKDNGVGMPTHIKNRIFEPFFSTKGDGGSGLGLSICRDVVARHRGRIEVDSKERVGTTFTIFLPAFDGGEAQP